MEVWFSSALKLELDVNTGALSFKLITLTVIACVADKSPSEAVTVAEYEDFVS